MLNLEKNQLEDNMQSGSVAVEYVVIISILIGLILVVVILMVNPTGAIDDSILPKSYNAVGQKIGQFGTLPE